MSKLLLLGAQHGNELLGQRLYAHIARSRPQLMPFITYKTANLKAYRQGVRYVESDMNRSYTGKTRTYEERRAKQILRYITQNKFDLVLDLHTTTCKQPPCFIVADMTPHINSYLRASSIHQIVQMKHQIVTASLIGTCPLALSIEINETEAMNETLLDLLCDDIERYLSKKAGEVSKTIYQVSDLLLKTEIDEQEALTLRNFHRSSEGFYPILVGENSYKRQTEYLGFKAYKIQSVTL